MSPALIGRGCAEISQPILSFWVCEKSDGVRVLMLIAFNGAAGRQDIFLVCTDISYLAHIDRSLILSARS